MTSVSRRAFLASVAAAAVSARLPAIAPAQAAAPAAVTLPPLTLASLKRLSEQALPILERYFADSMCGDAFLAEENDSQHGMQIVCDHPRGAMDWCLRCSNALAGTPMIGGWSGYYEREWDETTAFARLQDVLWWNEQPAEMSDADWIAALALIGTTPAAHAQHLADMERNISEWCKERPFSEEAA